MALNLLWTSALHSHDGPTTATASASQFGFKAASVTAAELHQPAGDNPGKSCGRATGLRGVWARGQGQPSSCWLASPFPQAQQMTTQAMSLSLEQQNQRRQHQAQASGPATQAPPSATAPKLKKLPTPQEKPESDLEPSDVCFRVRSQG